MIVPVGGGEKKNISFKKALECNNDINKLNSIHPKQVLSFENYKVSNDSCICTVSFDAVEDNIPVFKEVEFNLNYPTTEESVLKVFNNMTKTAIFRKYKDIFNVNVVRTQRINNKRVFLFVYNIKFDYETKRGTKREDTRIIISKCKIDNVTSYFKSIIENYNLKFPYRKILNVSLKDIEETNIADIKILKKLSSLDPKDKSRIIINESNEGVVILNKISAQYKTDRGKIKTSDFILPLAGYTQEKRLTNQEIENLINQNKQRKVSNVKILDTKALMFIKL